MKTICIEGNIACGKSTFLLKLSNQFPNLKVYQEPVEKWKVFLENAYKTDKKENSFKLQQYIQETMKDIHICNDEKKIIERSLLSVKHIFNKAFFENDEYYYKFLNGQNDEYYLKGNEINLIIYLKTDPKIAFERMKKRSRPEENTLNLDYIEKIHQYYEKFINNLTDKKISILDYNVDLNDFNFEEIFELINNF